MLRSIPVTLSHFLLNSGTPLPRRLAQKVSLFQEKAGGSGTSHPGLKKMPASLAPLPFPSVAASRVWCSRSMEDAEGCFALEVGNQGGMSLAVCCLCRELHDVLASQQVWSHMPVFIQIFSCGWATWGSQQAVGLLPLCLLIRVFPVFRHSLS